MSCDEHGDPDAGWFVGQIGVGQLQKPLHVHVIAPYVQAWTDTPDVAARQGVPSTGGVTGQLHLRVSNTVPQTQLWSKSGNRQV